MGKTDMSYYKDLLAGIAGAQIGAAATKILAPGASSIVGAGLGSQALRKKVKKPVVKKKKGGKVK